MTKPEVIHYQDSDMLFSFCGKHVQDINNDYEFLSSTVWSADIFGSRTHMCQVCAEHPRIQMEILALIEI